MRRSDFYYDLPPELIAQEPSDRGASRMLVVRSESDFDHRHIGDFPSLLEPEDTLVLNDTRVFPARLFALPTGNMQRRIEVLLVKRQGPMRWMVMLKPGRRVKATTRLRFSDTLACMVLEKNDDGTALVDFDGLEEHFWTEVERVGEPPLPPYIHRDPPPTGTVGPHGVRPAPRGGENDRDRYQTVYARERGAVAAPTAGLHFTEEILSQIETQGNRIVRITLHVGVGTFRPVKVDDIAEHRMDSERYSITEEAANALNDAKRIVAVGTTTVRTLESAIRKGEGRFLAGDDETDIFITPGFEFRAVDRLLTNFHLPESTLLMLVSAFAGMETIRNAYVEAIRERYHFYSYGDCMFLEGKR